MHMQLGDLCLVTGATGYLATWVEKFLLEQGFRVRGTVRSLSDTTRLNTLRSLLPGIELVEADLRSPKGWRAAVKDVKWIFHVASPQAVKSETNRTAGALSGTEYLLDAATHSHTVLKILVTSSEAAIAYGHPASKLHFDEADWTVVGGSGTSDYFKSKTLAERFAWDWAQDAKRNPHQIQVAVVNPCLIIGPTLVPWGRFSMDLIKQVAQGKMPMLPDTTVQLVDVRDCASMHIAVMQSHQANGRRHLSFGAVCRFPEIAAAIRKTHGHRGFNPPVRIAPKWLMWAMKFASADIAAVYHRIGQNTIYAQQHPEVYAYQYTDMTSMVSNTLDSLIQHGSLQPNA
jgi:dihydroflavonol-4-reductase